MFYTVLFYFIVWMINWETGIFQVLNRCTGWTNWPKFWPSRTDLSEFFLYKNPNPVRGFGEKSYIPHSEQNQYLVSLTFKKKGFKSNLSLWDRTQDRVWIDAFLWTRPKLASDWKFSVWDQINASRSVRSLFWDFFNF